MAGVRAAARRSRRERRRHGASSSASGCRRPRRSRACGRCASRAGRRSKSWPASSSRRPPSCCCRRSSSGAAFPAAARLVAGAAHVGRDVGVVAAVNTAGGIAGSLLTGFVLVPRLGLVRSIGALAVAGAVLAGIAVLKSGRAGRRPAALAGAIVLVVATLAALIAARPARHAAGRESVADGCCSTTRRPAARWRSSSNRRAGRSFRRLYVQGVSNSGDAPASLRYMRLQALLPLLVHRGEPRSALVVGFGTGITAGALLADAGARAARRRRAAALGGAGRLALLGQPGRGDGRPSRDPHRRRATGAAAPVRALRRDHARAAAAFGGRSREPLLARLLRARGEPAAAGRPDGAVVAAARPERRRLPLARAQLPRRVPPCERLDHGAARGPARGLAAAPRAGRGSRREALGATRRPGCARRGRRRVGGGAARHVAHRPGGARALRRRRASR